MKESVERASGSSGSRAFGDVARPSATGELRRVDTPGVATIAELCSALDLPAESTAKAIVVMGDDVIDGISDELTRDGVFIDVTHPQIDVDCRSESVGKAGHHLSNR